MNRFGDLFMAVNDGSVQMLDISGGTLTTIAESRRDFEEKLQMRENAIAWFLIPLIDGLVARGSVLLDGQCYGLRQPTALNGKYTFENICVTSIWTCPHSVGAK